MSQMSDSSFVTLNLLVGLMRPIIRQYISDLVTPRLRSLRPAESMFESAEEMRRFSDNEENHIRDGELAIRKLCHDLAFGAAFMVHEVFHACPRSVGRV